MVRKNGNGTRGKLPPELWEQIFRSTQVPLFVENFTRVRQSIRQLLDDGVEDFGLWLESHPEFVSTTLQNLAFLDVNERAVEVFGARDQNHLLRSFELMVVPETLNSFKEILTAIAEDRPFYQGEGQYRTLDGRSLYTFNRALIPEHIPGEPDILVLATTDITPLKEAQLRLADSESRYRVLVETAQDVILCHDLNGRIEYVNRAGLDLTGWTLEEMRQMTIRDLVVERMHGEMEKRLEERAQGFGGTFLFDINIMTRDGSEVPLEISTTRLPGLGDGRPQVIALMRDISERKALEARMLSNQKTESLGALAGGIAHDFNNLLATILGNVELMGESEEACRRWGENLESITLAGQKAADLCQQMLAYSGRGELQVDNGDLSSLVQDMRRLLEASVSSRARLNLQLGEDLPAVPMDSTSLRQVLMALVSNAVEALDDDGGEIVVRTSLTRFEAGDLADRQCMPPLPPGEYVVCEVADSGEGMDRATRHRIFDPFFSTRTRGRGLGLSAAMGIVQGHKGGMLVDSAPSVGTTVSVLLPPAPRPVARPRRRRKKAPDSLHEDLAGKLILLVDEDAPVRKVCEGYLRRLGCSVLSVGNGPDSVRIFSQRFDEVDVVILDLGMVEMDGVATMRRLRVIRPDVPVIFSTGYGESELKKRAGGLEGYGYIAKPFKLATVRQALAVALGKSPD